MDIRPPRGVARAGGSGNGRILQIHQPNGAPGAKADILGELMRRHGLASPEMLMVGDGLSDYQAAQQAEVPFILRQTPEQEELFSAIQVDRVRDMAELAPLLESRLGGASMQPLAAGRAPGRS